jgi:predicted ATP-grasp superfamily ATP-dependent carboligase
MRSSWPATSLRPEAVAAGSAGGAAARDGDAAGEGPVLLIAAQSARALVCAARRAGFVPLAVDLFGDDDTAALSAGSRRVAGLGAVGVSRAFEDMLARHGPCDVAGLVLGSGFEGRPGLVAALSGRFGLLGNAAEVMRRAKDPFALAALCREAGVPHPEVRPASRVDGVGDAAGAGWLLKRRGASGGGHVRAMHGPAPSRGCYAQRRVAGAAVSACFVADGRRATLLGFSAQWSDPAPGAAFRYGGAVRPAACRFEAELAEAVARLARALGLVGLNGADFLVGRDGFHLIEINPRPGASLDVFADALPMRLHVAACRDGALPDAAPPLPRATAAVVAYAARDGRVAPGFAWPDWAADRQRVGQIRAGAPFCTATATADRPEAARRLAVARAAALLGRAGLSPARLTRVRRHRPGATPPIGAHAA